VKLNILRVSRVLGGLSLGFFGGLAVESGLCVGSIEKLRLKYVNFDYDSQIGIIRVSPEAAKAKVGYYTFFSLEAKEALREHLQYRRRKVNSESPLIKPPAGKRQPYRRNLRFQLSPYGDISWTIPTAGFKTLTIRVHARSIDATNSRFTQHSK